MKTNMMMMMMMMYGERNKETQTGTYIILLGYRNVSNTWKALSTRQADRLPSIIDPDNHAMLVIIIIITVMQ